MLSLCRIIPVFVKTAMRVILASVTCTGRPIPALADERFILLALGKALSPILAVLVV